MVMVKMNQVGLLILLALSGLGNCQQRCAYDLEEIKRGLNESGRVTSFVLNCLAHNGTHAEFISISVFNDDGIGSSTYDDGDMKYDFRCVGNTTLIPTISDAVSNISNPACHSCNFSAADPCVNSK